MADIDPSHWKLSPKDAYDRRTYFWTLLQGELWQVGATLALAQHNAHRVLAHRVWAQGGPLR